MPVAENLPFEKYAAVTIRQPELPGVAPLRAFSRFYPDGAAVAHLVGYVGTPNQEEYEKEDKAPLLITPGFKIGKEGRREDDGDAAARPARGAAGRGHGGRQAGARADRRSRTRAAAPCRSTIDAGLQTFAARRLGEESGSVVVLDCLTGDILALASMPAYDPNSFTDGISRNEWKMLSDDERKPLLNKALNGLYPPGSTFKPMVAMALLQAGIDPKAQVNCPGGFQLGNRFFRCLGRHGSMTMHTAIARSCNTYFYAMGRRAGIDIISAMGKRLGFGQKFDIPVVSQNYGTMPSAEWKKARYERSAKLVERPDWTESDTLNTSIGQGFVIVNPLQLAVMAGRIASGRDIQPNLIQRKRPPPAALPYPEGAFRHGPGRHVGSGERRRHRRPKQARASRDRDGRQDRHRPGPPDHRRPARPVRRLEISRPRPVRLLRPDRQPALRLLGGDRARHGRRPGGGAGRQGRAHLSVRQAEGDGRRSPRSRSNGAAHSPSGWSARAQSWLAAAKAARRRAGGGDREPAANGPRLRPGAAGDPALADALDRRPRSAGPECSASIRRPGAS